MNQSRSLEPDNCILVCGTVAFDHIGVTDQPFGERNTKLASMQRHFGGCGGNVAYNLAAQGHAHVLVAFAGTSDFAPYAEHMRRVGVNATWIDRSISPSSAQAFIFTAPDGDQFTAFQPVHVTPEQFSDHIHRSLEANMPKLSIVAPDTPHNMLIALQACSHAGTVVWCPGQYSELLSRQEHETMNALADIIIVNRAESRHLARSRTNDQVRIITNGAGDIHIENHGVNTRVKVPASVAVDPTGCGDAFAAGFAVAWLGGAELADACRQGSSLAAPCLGVAGSQNHTTEDYS